MEKEHINPPGIYKHPAFTRIISVKGPMKIIFIAGQTPSDEDYNCVAPGDFLGQYNTVMDNLDVQLKARRGYLGRCRLPADLRAGCR